MSEYFSAGLVMLRAEVEVAVTREEHHQDVLARYAVTPGTQRLVSVELAWCVIDSGKYRGEHAVEVRLNGLRVGELSYAMSQRYAPVVSHVTARGGRPGCVAKIEQGKTKREIVLRLPRRAEGDGTVPRSPAPAFPSPPTSISPAPAPRQRNHQASWKLPVGIAAAVIVLLVGAMSSNDDTPSGTTAADNYITSPVPTSTTTATTTPATTTATTTSATTTTRAERTSESSPTSRRPDPDTTRKAAAPPPPPEPEPESACDPNYSGCVPIASDVDCAGGSGNGPAYATGPVRVTGRDIYRLDSNNDGVACE